MFPIDDDAVRMMMIQEEDDVDPNEVDEEDESSDEEEVVPAKVEESKEEVDEPKDKADEKTDNDFDFEIEEKPKEEKEDEFVIPDKFETVEAERDFYKENFTKIKESTSNPEDIATRYEEQLLSKEKDVEELKALRDALNGQPDALVKIRFKDALIKGGYDHRLTQEEQNNIIDTELRKSFGSNYRDVFDQEDAEVEGTLSYNMIKKQEELIGNIDSYNQKPQQEPQQQLDPEEGKKIIHESLSKVGVKDENIDKFINELKTTDLLNNPVKLYKAIYMKQIMDKRIRQAKEEGRKEALAEISKVGSKPVKDDGEKVNKTKAKEVDYGNNYN